MAERIRRIKDENFAEALKVPPHSVPAEQGVIGSLMLDRLAWDKVADMLVETDFYRRDHQLIFKAIKVLAEQQSPLDVVTLSETLDRLGWLNDSGGLPYLASLAKDTPSAANISAYAEIVREKSVLRQLISSGGDIADLAYFPQNRSTPELIESAEQKVFRIADQYRRQGTGFKPIKPLVTAAVERIEMLFHNKGHMTGVPTGYHDLDDRTSGLQPADLIIIAGRPSMGKCCAADTEILSVDGSISTLEEVYRRHDAELLTLGNDWKFHPARPSHFVDDGLKPVFRVRTRLGRYVDTTLSHPYLTMRGWRPLAELEVGEKIAVPRALPVFGKQQWLAGRVRLLAYLLGDGCLTGSQVKFTNNNRHIQADFMAAVEEFGGLRAELRERPGKATDILVAADSAFNQARRFQFSRWLRERLAELGLSQRQFALNAGVSPAGVCYWLQGRQMPESGVLERIGEMLGGAPSSGASAGALPLSNDGPNPLIAWLRELGLWGKGAHGKSIPAPVFQLARPQLALFLNRLFATDGWASVLSSGQAQLGFCSVSEKLARQTQHLLLRFGIVAALKTRAVRYGDTLRTAYQLDITDARSISSFIEEIGILGKEDAVDWVRQALAGRRYQTNRDLIPVEVWETLAEAKGDESWASLARRAGLFGDSNIHVGQRALSRSRLSALAGALNSPALAALADSEVYWDEIVAIEALGLGQVYDLTIPDTHNFVANDVCVHNTSFCMNIAEHVAIQERLPVAVFSMEMPAEQLVLRMISSLGRIEQGRVRTGRMEGDDWPRMTSAINLLADTRLYIDDTPAMTPTEVRARCRRLARENGGKLGLVVLDYLQLMQSPGSESRVNEISDISRSLKGMAKELGVPVIALSQLNRSLEQRPNKRPVMSDLRECVPGDTLVCLADGRRVPIRDLVDTMPEVLAMSEDQKIVRAQSDKVWKVGKKPLRKLLLASGRVLRATGQHRIFTGQGWQTMAELALGDRVALSRSLPEPLQPAEWPDHQLVLLGHLIGDGSYLVHQPLRYTTASEENSQAVRESAEAFGCTVTRHEGRGAWHQLVISGNGDRWHPRGVNLWLRQLGIYGQRSHEKHLPEGVFSLPNRQIALLLRHLWATDGCISVARPEAPRAASRVYFSTSSERLARDVAALLLRFSIVARIRLVAQRVGRPVWTVDISSLEQQRRFIEAVGVFGPRVAQAQKLMQALAGKAANTNVDTLPVEVFQQVKTAMRAQGISQRGMAALRGTAYAGSGHFSYAPSRNTLASYAELLDEPALRVVAESDLFWDRVVGIEPDGEEDVYDLTVPGPASWLADGVVSHNSGAIEQDADLILFIYRDEVYNAESPEKGIAEIIIAKQRNGPIGTVRLTFQGQYTRFENHVDGSYALEGPMPPPPRDLPVPEQEEPVSRVPSYDLPSFADPSDPIWNR
jgi:replicative DNA helicase